MRTVVLDIRVLQKGGRRLIGVSNITTNWNSANQFVLLQTGDARALSMTSCADKVWLQQGLEIFWQGIGGRHTFYGGMLTRYGIEADIEAAGEFKSFGEVYTRTGPSEANKVQLNELYSDLQEQVLLTIAEEKNCAIEELRTFDAISLTPRLL